MSNERLQKQRAIRLVENVIKQYDWIIDVEYHRGSIRTIAEHIIKNLRNSGHIPPWRY